MQKRTKGFLMLVMLILGLIFGGSSGCTNQETKGMTPEEKAYFIEDKRIKAREKFVDFIIACHYKGHVLLYQGGNTRIHGVAHVQRDGVVYIPRHHRQHDYQCGSTTEIRQALEDAGLYGDPRLSRRY